MSFGESIFSAENQQGGLKRQKEPKLTTMKTTLEDSRGKQKTPHYDRPRGATRWG
jgi:hypothetical protein